MIAGALHPTKVEIFPDGSELNVSVGAFHVVAADEIEATRLEEVEITSANKTIKSRERIVTTS